MFHPIQAYERKMENDNSKKLFSICSEKNYFSKYLLFGIEKCPLESVKWSPDLKFIKIIYSKFQQEYLEPVNLQFDTVLSFILRLEECGFTYVYDPVESDIDILIFQRLYGTTDVNSSCNFPVSASDAEYSGGSGSSVTKNEEVNKVSKDLDLICQQLYINNQNKRTKLDEDFNFGKCGQLPYEVREIRNKKSDELYGSYYALASPDTPEYESICKLSNTNSNTNKVIIKPKVCSKVKHTNNLSANLFKEKCPTLSPSSCYLCPSYKDSSAGCITEKKRGRPRKNSSEKIEKRNIEFLKPNKGSLKKGNMSERNQFSPSSTINADNPAIIAEEDDYKLLPPLYICTNDKKDCDVDNTNKTKRRGRPPKNSIKITKKKQNNEFLKRNNSAKKRKLLSNKNAKSSPLIIFLKGEQPCPTLKDTELLWKSIGYNDEDNDVFTRESSKHVMLFDHKNNTDDYVQHLLDAAKLKATECLCPGILSHTDQKNGNKTNKL